MRNTGTVSWDDPDRQQPYFHQISMGYEREIFTGVSASVDYVRMNGRNMFFNPNLNIALGTNDTRDGPRQDPGPDPFGVLRPSLAPGEPMYTANTTVRYITTQYGYSDYDALNMSVEKRYSHNFSARAAYSFGYSRGITAGQGDTPQLQTLADLHLAEYEALAGTDRAHNFTLSGRVEIPKTNGVTLSGTLRIDDRHAVYDSGRHAGFAIATASTSRRCRPARTTRPRRPSTTSCATSRAKAAGTARVGPGFMQFDMRVGYRARLGGRRTLDIFYETFNVTDRANFTNPGGNRRLAADFLRLVRPPGRHRLPAPVADRTSARLLDRSRGDRGVRGDRVGLRIHHHAVRTIPTIPTIPSLRSPHYNGIPMQSRRVLPLVAAALLLGRRQAPPRRPRLPHR